MLCYYYSCWFIGWFSDMKQRKERGQESNRFADQQTESHADRKPGRKSSRQTGRKTNRQTG